MIKKRIAPFFQTLRSEKSISKLEAERAIYIDFEGFSDRAPSLVGIQCDDKFWQVVFSNELALAAAAKGILVSDGETVIGELLERAKSENRKIVAYSSFEKEQCYRWYQIDISGVYVNANLIAKSWKKIAHPKTKVSGLKEYLKLVDYPRGNYLGIKQSTQRIDSVAKMLMKRNSFDLLTPVVKGKWTKLLDHNKIDVEGMKFLVLKTLESR